MKLVFLEFSCFGEYGRIEVWSICHWCLYTCSLPAEMFSHVVIKQVSAAYSHDFPWNAMYRLISDSLSYRVKHWHLELSTWNLGLRPPYPIYNMFLSLGSH